MQNPLKMEFMNESYGQWFIFIGVMIAILFVWGGVLRALRG